MNTPVSKITRIVRMPLRTEKQVAAALNHAALARPGARDRDRLRRFVAAAREAWWARRCRAPGQSTGEV